jgi:hypothetical protein
VNFRGEPPRDPGLPEVGYYLLRLVRQGPLVPAQIVCVDGLWHAEIDGVAYAAAADPAEAPKVFDIWLRAARTTPEEYAHLLVVAEWARKHQPDHPAANPGKPISLGNMPPLF